MAGRAVKIEGDFQLYFAPMKIKFYAEGLSIGCDSFNGLE